jgi:hypothetical protein
MKTVLPFIGLSAPSAMTAGEFPGIRPVIAAGRLVRVNEVPAPRNSTTGQEKVNSKLCASEITVTWLVF